MEKMTCSDPVPFPLWGVDESEGMPPRTFRLQHRRRHRPTPGNRYGCGAPRQEPTENPVDGECLGIWGDSQRPMVQRNGFSTAAEGKPASFQWLLRSPAGGVHGSMVRTSVTRYSMRKAVGGPRGGRLPAGLLFPAPPRSSCFAGGWGCQVHRDGKPSFRYSKGAHNRSAPCFRRWYVERLANRSGSIWIASENIRSKWASS